MRYMRQKRMQPVTKNIVKYWLPLYAYGALIFYMSSMPKPLPSISIPSFDKALHIIEYSIFGFLAVRAFRYSPTRVFYKNFKVLAILLTLLYGISDEVHQLFVPSRESSIFDIIADAIGGILGVFIHGRYHTF